MYIAIDIILIVVMAATVYSGFKRGFVVSLFSIVSVALSIIAACMFYKELGIYLNDNFISVHIDTYVSEFVADAVTQSGGALTADAIPEVVLKAADALKLDLEAMLSGFSGEADDFAKSISSEISAAVSYVIAFVTLFFAALIILKLLCFILDKCANLPVLEKLNKFFGILLGAAEALLLGILIAEVSTALCGAYGALNNDPAFVDVSQKTVVAKFLVSIFPW